MQRKYFVFKLLFALSAIAVQLKVALPSYALKLRMTERGISVALVRTNGFSAPKDSTLAAAPAGATPPEPAGASPGPHAVGKARAPATATAAAAGGPARGETEAPGAQAARVEFMNIARDGTSVLAGSASPGANVNVYENGTLVGTATAGADGDWSLATEHRFASADPSGTLTAMVAPPGAAAPPSLRSGGPAASGTGEIRPAGEARQAATAEAKSEAKGPAAHLIKEFANTVAMARQEAERQEVEANANAKEALPPGSTGTELAHAGAVSGKVAGMAPPEPEIIPIPMQFVFRETTLTDEGGKAVDLLIEYLKLKRYDSVTLSGHADERGSAEFNLDLSRRRLEAVIDLLRKGGYQGAVVLLPKGKGEPYVKVDRAQFGYEDLMQLDRRVELRVAR